MLYVVHAATVARKVLLTGRHISRILTMPVYPALDKLPSPFFLTSSAGVVGHARASFVLEGAPCCTSHNVSSASADDPPGAR